MANCRSDLHCPTVRMMVNVLAYNYTYCIIYFYNILSLLYCVYLGILQCIRSVCWLS